MVVNALQRSNELGGLIDSLGYSQFQSTVYDDLGKIRSLDEISALREKYRQSAVGSIHVYEQRLAAMSPEKRRALEALHSGSSTCLRRNTASTLDSAARARKGKFSAPTDGDQTNWQCRLSVAADGCNGSSARKSVGYRNIDGKFLGVFATARGTTLRLASPVGS